MSIWDSLSRITEKGPDMVAFRLEVGKLIDERKAIYDAALVAYIDKKFKETGLQVELSEDEKWTEGTRALAGFRMIELVNVNLNELTEDDARMWYKVINNKKRPLSIKEFRDYKNKASASGNVSRDNFAQVLANKTSLEFYK
jgi:hypothetical protein